MTKLFKNSKSVLSLVLAFAVLAVSLFTGVVINADAACGTNVIYYNGAAAVAPTQTDADGNVLITTANELRWVVQNGSEADPTKTYKVADGIDAIVLQPEYKIAKIGGFDALKNATTAQIADWFSKQIDGEDWNNWHAAADKGFAATFDGNGVTIYGMSNKGSNVGLFHYVTGNVTIKNVKVTKSYLVGSSAVGAIFGKYETTNDAYGTITVDSCAVTDCYIESTGMGYATGAAAIYGMAHNYKNGNGPVYVNNCYVNLDEQYFITKDETEEPTGDDSSIHGGLGSWAVTNQGMASNCVVIGIRPYSWNFKGVTNNHQHTNDPARFSNVYTDAPNGKVTVGGKLETRTYSDSQVKTLSLDAMKGAAAIENMNLDWSVWMADDEGYPELRIFHKNIATNDQGDGKHTEVCTCGFGGLIVEHAFNKGVCACGVKLNCSTRQTVAWDGTVATTIAEGSGTPEAPYIIKTAEEFAYVVSLGEATEGKYYKVADHIGAIVLQKPEYAEAIMALDSAEAVSKYFEDSSKITPQQWVYAGWAGKPFCGNLDGNGATIYGLYSCAKDGNNRNPALFPAADAGAVFSNLAIKNSYVVGEPGWDASLFVAIVDSKGYGLKKSGEVQFNNCAIVNNYLRSDVKRAGVVVGTSQNDLTLINNCLIYGNDTQDTAGTILPITYNLYNEYKDAEGNFMYHRVTNSVVFGSKPYGPAWQERSTNPLCYTNVYTDSPAGEFWGTNNKAYAEDQLKQITADELATLNVGDAWITAAVPELKVFHDAEFESVSDATTHKLTCSCGLVVSEGAHDWSNKDGVCKDCSYKCVHTTEFVELTPATCTEAAWYYVECSNCKFNTKDIPNGTMQRGEPAGHNTVNVPAEPATCTSTGIVQHKHCIVCEKNFDIVSGVELETVIIEKKPHPAATDDEGNTAWAKDDNYHWSYCNVCGVDEVIGEKIAHNSERWNIDGANGHQGTCSVCKLEQNEMVPHNFGTDNVCDQCEWKCEAHQAGEPARENEDPKTCTEDGSYDLVTRCTICKSIMTSEHIVEPAGHTVYWTWEENRIPACLQDGSYDEVGTCDVCKEEVRVKHDIAKQGHIFNQSEGWEANCIEMGAKPYQVCYECNKYFEPDVTDIYSEEGYDFDHFRIEIDADAHTFKEVEAVAATCDADGAMAYKYCTNCYYAVSADGAVEGNIEVDTEVLYATFEVELVPYQEAINNANSMQEHFEAMNAMDAAKAEIYNRLLAENATALFVVEGGHKLGAVDKVAATYEAEGKEAHYACSECDKLFSDKEGKNEVTAESLKIAKLVKVEEQKPAGGDNNTTAPSGDATTGGDTSKESPKTGESVASVAAVAALMGAAFVLVRKSKKA